MSFTDGKPFTATEAQCKGPWLGRPNGELFRCFLCGHKFEPGDVVRWQYTNDVSGAGGNPLVCEKCDGPKEVIVEEMREGYAAVRGRYWYFARALANEAGIVAALEAEERNR